LWFGCSVFKFTGQITEAGIRVDTKWRFQFFKKYDYRFLLGVIIAIMATFYCLSNNRYVFRMSDYRLYETDHENLGVVTKHVSQNILQNKRYHLPYFAVLTTVFHQSIWLMQRSETLLQNVTALHVIALVTFSERQLEIAIIFPTSAER
jgi:hypothetical protein